MGWWAERLVLADVSGLCFHLLLLELRLRCCRLFLLLYVVDVVVVGVFH